MRQKNRMQDALITWPCYCQDATLHSEARWQVSSLQCLAVPCSMCFESRSKEHKLTKQLQVTIASQHEGWGRKWNVPCRNSRGSGTIALQHLGVESHHNLKKSRLPEVVLEN